MAGTFSNPRLNALPCERMRGCSFAEDFTTSDTVSENFGSDGGAGNAFDHGLITVGTGQVTYDVVPQAGSFSVVCRFKRLTAASSDEYLVHNCNTAVPDNGFYILLDATGIRANHESGGVAKTEVGYDFTYAGSTWHTVTYVVDVGNNKHYLYVDGYNSSEETGVYTGVGSTNVVIVAAGSGGTSRFTGAIEKIRIFDNVLTEAEHDLYHADTLTDFWSSPVAAFRCDSFSNDTATGGNKIWDRTTNCYDLIKGDRSTASTFPTFNSTPTEHYTFDGATDYIAKSTTLATAMTNLSAYTITAAKSLSGYATGTAFPTIDQANDETFLDTLESAGGYTGNLHSLVVHNKALTQLELYHDEYMHFYYLWRGRAYGFVQRLIVENVACLAVYFDYPAHPYTDYVSNVVGTPTLITGGGEDGILFASATSNVEYPDSAALECTDCTISVYGDFASSVAAGVLVDKGTNYKLETNGNNILFNGSNIAHTFSNNEHILVSCKSGNEPRFYVDGAYIGEGSTTETPDNTDTTVLNIGNNNEKNSPTAYQLRQVQIYNVALA